MPRDIPVGNGQLLVCFDGHYQIRDLYFPHVGQENHAGGGPCRFGVWAAIPQTPATQTDRRKRRLFWSNQGWHIQLKYLPGSLTSDVVMRHEQLAVELRCNDVVDFHRPLLVRRIEVTNHDHRLREVGLFHHNNFNMYGTKVGDTVYYDPQLKCLIHYCRRRYLMTAWHADGQQRLDEWATGTAGYFGAEGTWRDAEDGVLGNNPIAQGAVDSTMMLRLKLEAGKPRVVYMLLGAGRDYGAIKALRQFLDREGPQSVIDRTTAYWRLWLSAARNDFPPPEEGGPSNEAIELYKRSLLIVRSQVDDSGSIIAANDSDVMQFSRDTYSYLWPRDGALVAAAFDDAGLPAVSRSFYQLCARLIAEGGYFLHKYNPDGSLASSWHPWSSLGKPQLPIQEDETALVIWALWRHFLTYRDIEFVRPLWVQLITKAADFLVRFTDPDTGLPLPSYDLWEERWGVHAFTVATVYAGLRAAEQFAGAFGDMGRAEVYGKAAAQMKEAFGPFFWSPQHGRILRRIVPLDHDRTARMMAAVLEGRKPESEGAVEVQIPATGKRRRCGQGSAKGGDGPLVGKLEWELDSVVDSSLYGVFAFGLLPVDDERVQKTMAAVEERLTVKTPVGGVARYENDTYHRASEDARQVPGNPWFICTMWLAYWRIAKARTVDELKSARELFDWAVKHALPSGVLAEQVHPHHHGPLSVSPLTWSHATVVSAVLAYVRKLEGLMMREGKPPGAARPEATITGDEELFDTPVRRRLPGHVLPG